MTRAEILDKAKDCVCGQREQDYGKLEDNFATIAGLWGAYKDTEFSAEDVAVMMALMKIARIKTGTSTDDCFVDLAGYAACGGEIASGEKSKTSERNDYGVSFSEAATNLSRFLKRELKWGGALSKNEFRVSFNSRITLLDVAIGIMGFLSAKGRMTVRELREILDFKCGLRDSVHPNFDIYYEGDPINGELGWGDNVVANYTRDRDGRYTLILPYPTVLDNKEDI